MYVLAEIEIFCVIIINTAEKAITTAILKSKLKPTAKFCLIGIVIFVQTKLARIMPINKPK